VGKQAGLKIKPVVSFRLSVLRFWAVVAWNFSGLFLVELKQERYVMLAFLLWCILFVVCWPLALLALVLYPFVWVLLLPFRLVGIAVHGVLALVWAVVMLPARLLSAPFRV
jgi:hypothetical protein